MTPATNLLRGEKVRLTALTDSDVPTLTAWYSDGEFLRLFDTPVIPKTAAEVSKWLEDMQKSSRNFAFAVRPIEGDKLIGYLEIDGIQWTHGTGGMGLGIGDPADRGQGYGYEAGQMGLRLAFHELNLHRITVTVFEYNTHSLALCEKLGFQREGVYREHLQHDGRRYDTILLGLLRREWEARQA